MVPLHLCLGARAGEDRCYSDSNQDRQPSSLSRIFHGNIGGRLSQHLHSSSNGCRFFAHTSTEICAVPPSPTSMDHPKSLKTFLLRISAGQSKWARGTVDTAAERTQDTIEAIDIIPPAPRRSKPKDMNAVDDPPPCAVEHHAHYTDPLLRRPSPPNFPESAEHFNKLMRERSIHKSLPPQFLVYSAAYISPHIAELGLPPASDTPARVHSRPQIEINLPRTRSGVCLCLRATNQHALERILYIWVIRHPAGGYVQGINNLVTPIDSDFETFEPATLPVHALHRGRLILVPQPFGESNHTGARRSSTANTEVCSARTRPCKALEWGATGSQDKGRGGPQFSHVTIVNDPDGEMFGCLPSLFLSPRDTESTGRQLNYMPPSCLREAGMLSQLGGPKFTHPVAIRSAINSRRPNPLSTSRRSGIDCKSVPPQNPPFKCPTLRTRGGEVETLAGIRYEAGWLTNLPPPKKGSPQEPYTSGPRWRGRNLRRRRHEA
ncbi:hypothetical protein DFH09DRAFT_1074824 [Mycena vulgaris]|nr:hypothetical protein DFH09DRAFT_1074824 [Mycena vulgaris]